MIFRDLSHHLTLCVFNTVSSHSAPFPYYYLFIFQVVLCHKLMSSSKNRHTRKLTLLTPNPNFRHQFFNVKVSTHRWHILGVLQMCPLTSLVKYFRSTMTMAPSRGVQSWKKGPFSGPLDIFPGYWEPKLDKISVGWFVLYPQELNPARYEVHGLCQSPKRKPLKIMKNSHNSLKL